MKGWHVTPIEGVEITYQWKDWLITASWPQRDRRDIKTVLKVERTDTHPPRLVISSTLINLLSSSAKTNMARAMRGGDKNPDIDMLLENVCENLVGWYRNTGTTISPVPTPFEGERYLSYPIWPSREGTLVSAASNSFKSFIAAALYAQCNLGVEILRGNTKPSAPTPIWYLDYEGHADTFGERLYAILNGAGLPLEPCGHYRRLTQRFSEIADAIADEIKRRHIGGVIIDSLSAAVGASLKEDDAANDFWNAVALLEVPTLVLAHKSREAIDRGKKAAFGSNMHENRPRFIWDAVRPDMQGPAVKWEVFNDNNLGVLGHKLAWNVRVETVGEEEHRRLESVSFQGCNPDDVRIPAEEGRTQSDLIFYAITECGPLDTARLSEECRMTTNQVRAVLSRNKDLFYKLDDGLRWGLK